MSSEDEYRPNDFGDQDSSESGDEQNITLDASVDGISDDSDEADRDSESNDDEFDNLQDVRVVDLSNTTAPLNNPIFRTAGTPNCAVDKVPDAEERVAKGYNLKTL